MRGAAGRLGVGAGAAASACAVEELLEEFFKGEHLDDYRRVKPPDRPALPTWHRL